MARWSVRPCLLGHVGRWRREVVELPTVRTNYHRCNVVESPVRMLLVWLVVLATTLTGQGLQEELFGTLTEKTQFEFMRYQLMTTLRSAFSLITS